MDIKKDFQKEEVDELVVTVTELSWAVSKVLNTVSLQQKNVVVTNRGEAIAMIIPYTNDSGRSSQSLAPKSTF